MGEGVVFNPNRHRATEQLAIIIENVQLFQQTETLRTFNEDIIQNMTNGLGFIAVALVYFGGWRPWGVMWGALLFSMVNSLQLWMQVLNIPIPSDFAVMMPYILTILALIITVQRVRPPSALTKPFERGH